ncbi:MAG: hypothetical protein H7210_10855 [Pyrinomonadaceae bacterium]|nr:hypothetical protein [Phycisphaerales bacterium]
MTPGIPTKVIASSMGLAAFVIATIAGLAVDNPADSILVRSIVCMFGCHLLGMIVGTLAERAIADAITRYVATHPVSDSEGAA